MKKILACMLCAFTMCTASSVTAFAAQEVPQEEPAAIVLCEVQEEPEAVLTADAGLVLEAEAADAEFDDDDDDEEAGLGIFTIPVGILIGIVISLLIMFGLASQLRSVKMQTQAAEYIKKGSFKLTHSRDVFLYSRVEKTKKEDRD